METRLFETSSVLGLRGTGGSKNTISQVVSHELKISEHGFPVRLLHCRPQTHPHPPQTHPHYTAHTVFQDRRLASLQPDEEICWNERQRGGRKKICQVIWTQIHDPHTLFTCPTHPLPWFDCHLRMFSQCFTIQFLWSVPQGSVN